MRAFIALVMASCLGAQTGWEAVEGLKAGTRVRVSPRQGARIEGKVEAVSGQGMVIRRGKQVERLERGQIRRVEQRVSRAKHIGMGAAIGAAGGAGTAGILIAAQRPDFTWRELTFGMALFGAAIGTGVGAAIPRHRTIYEAP